MIGAEEASVHENKILIQSKMLQYVMVGLLLIVGYLLFFGKTEGFTVGGTPIDIEATVKTSTETLYGNLNINAYKSNYSNLTSELIRWADYSMLTSLTRGKFDTDDLTEVKKFNELYNFKQNMIDFNKTVSSFS